MKHGRCEQWMACAVMAAVAALGGCDRRPKSADAAATTQASDNGARVGGQTPPTTGPSLSPAELQKLTRRATEVEKLNDRLIARRDHFDTNVKQILSARDTLLKGVSEGPLKDAELPRRWYEFAASNGGAPDAQLLGGQGAVDLNGDPIDTAPDTRRSVVMADAMDAGSVRQRIRAIEFSLLGGQPSGNDVQFIEEQEVGLAAAHAKLDESEKTTADLIARLNKEFPSLNLRNANEPPAQALSTEEAARVREMMDRWQSRRIELSSRVSEYRQSRRDWLDKMRRAAASDPQAKSARDSVQADDLSEKWTNLLSKLYALDRGMGAGGSDLFPADAKTVTAFDAELKKFEDELNEQKQIMREWASTK